MRIGDYVRIKWGNGLQTISKCKNVVDMGDTQYAKDDYYIHTDHSGEVIYKTMIIKSSSNIIDLIEVGDYVNGGRAYRIIPPYIVVDDSEFSEDDTYLQEEDIKSIVTKQQFESMEYKVGE